LPEGFSRDEAAARLVKTFSQEPQLVGCDGLAFVDSLEEQLWEELDLVCCSCKHCAILGDRGTLLK